MRSLKNIKYTFRKYPIPLTLSMLGLVMAFCAFIIIGTQVRFEKSFDQFHPDADCIFRVDQSKRSDVFRSVLPPGFAEAVIHSSAHIEAGTISCPFVGEIYASVQDMDYSEGFKIEGNVVSEDFFQVFGIKVEEGNEHFVQANQMAIPRSIAERLFGKESAIGKEIEVKSGNFVQAKSWTIGAVYQDLPNNSQIRNQVLFPLSKDELQNYIQSNYICYLRIDCSENQELVAEEFNKNFDFTKHKFLSPIELTSLSDVYFQEETADHRVFRSGSRLQVYIMSVISFMILLVGFLNFTNFYTSLMPSRLKTIATRKVLGERAFLLRLEIICETVLLLVFAAVIALFIAVPVSDFLQSYDVVQESFHLDCYQSIVFLTLMLSVVGGILSGIYPALFATSTPMVDALKGQVCRNVSGKKIKTVLVVIQYVISSVLLIFVLFVCCQNHMMKQGDLNFDKDRIATVELTRKITGQKGNWLQMELLQNPMIEKVAFASELMGSQDSYMTEGFVYKESEFSSFLAFVSADFLKVMGIELLEGRNFKEQRMNDIIFNSYAKHAFDMEIGPLPGKNLNIVGFCDNVMFTSFRKNPSPMAYRYLPTEYGYTPIMYIRLSVGYDAISVVEFIKETIAKVDPDYPIEILFYDQILQEQYRRETRFSNILVCFSILAVLLSLLGVFSMVIFDIQHKRKEIALHKVFGADYYDVIWLGNKPYFWIVLIGFLVAVPIVWLLVSYYLESFIQHISISVWEFMVVFIFLELITASLVVWRYHSVAKENPKESLTI